ncbi:helix-turn-helix domain-containing protein [Methylorubrum sp. SL192]|uniref:helix-turn-helix domain-containing protein n=1 Tax=Methylorubrum sp. SL192 TaxID=2995167 RepID=UPI002276361F|nr:helix-turn-helix domain-containing protein [Methylorubrum sp. SL192]MCY1644381.1 helix-turn-helix domain-containing protein [Methylorubrum sp. SL192]
MADGVGDEIDSLKREAGVELDRELADQLGIDPSTIAGWRRRGAVPERYKLRVFSKAARSAGRDLPTSGLIGLREAYIFALIRLVVLEYPDAGYGAPNYEAIYFGFRLGGLHAYLKRRFGLESDPDKLFAIYNEVRTEIADADIPVWIETLRAY